MHTVCTPGSKAENLYICLARRARLEKNKFGCEKKEGKQYAPLNKLRSLRPTGPSQAHSAHLNIPAALITANECWLLNTNLGGGDGGELQYRGAKRKWLFGTYFIIRRFIGCECSCLGISSRERCYRNLITDCAPRTPEKCLRFFTNAE
jgi:hypothetical protein